MPIKFFKQKNKDPHRVSAWTWTKEGQHFHGAMKSLFQNVVYGRTELAALKDLLIGKKYFTEGKDGMVGSTKWFVMAKDAMLEENKQLILKELSIPERIAVRNAANFAVALDHADDMYYERFFWIQKRVFEIAPTFMAAGKEARIAMVEALRDEFFTYEKRANRVDQQMAIWNYAIRQIREREIFYQMLVWWVQYSMKHQGEWPTDEVSRLGIPVGDPKRWFPRGRGTLWDKGHGGVY
jgi:hypothetical protein